MSCTDLLAHCDCKKCISTCICSCRSIVSSVSAPIKKKSSTWTHETLCRGHLLRKILNSVSLELS